MQLNNDEMRRYVRHLSLPEVGWEGQGKVRAASVLCIGAGGLGSPVAMYLAAAGIGRLGIVDFDAVDLSNLQRQIIHGTGDIGRAKTDSARATIQRLNPEVVVDAFNERITSANAMNIIRPYDVVVDCSDNLPTRYLVNDACVFLRKTNIYGSIYRFEGQASVFAPHVDGPCYRCLYPEPPPPEVVPSCAAGGVLGVLPGIIGAIQATEAIKTILGCGTSLVGRLLFFDALEMKFRELKLRKDPRCPLCGPTPTVTKLMDYEKFCGGHRAAAPSAAHSDEVCVQEMKRALDNPALGVVVIDVREPDECRVACVKGVPNIPLSELPRRLSEIKPDQIIYLHCKSGRRSLKAVELLRQHGFKCVKSVKGGIGAWTEEIDPSVPKY